MIIKCNARRSGAGAFGPLLAYLRDDSKIGWELHSEKILSPRAAAAQMRGVAVHAPRCRKPALHISGAWAPEDKVTHEDVLRVVDMVVKEAKLQDHLWYAIGHRDTAHPHFHLIACLPHPESFKVLSVAQIFMALKRLARTIEKVFGLRSALDVSTAEVNPAMVRGIGEKPTFGRWARAIIGPLVERVVAKPNANWEELHGLLARSGVRYVPTMRGGILQDGWDPHYRIRGSRVHPLLSRRELENRIGPYEEPIDAFEIDRTAAYTTTIIEAGRPDRGPDTLRQRFIEACADAASQRRTPEEVAISRAHVRARRGVFRRRLDADLELLQELPPVYRLIVVAARMLVYFKEQHDFELGLARERRAERMKRSTLRWRPWLIEQARGGDLESMTYLRDHGITVGGMELREPPLLGWAEENRLSYAM